MAFEQVRFMGASVVDFNSTLGRETTPSSLSVTLVEDRSAGDSFLSPGIGAPVYFTMTAPDTPPWSFNGIIQNQEKIGNTGGNPIYTVTISDPREILDSSELILSGYNGSVESVPNLLNPFGYIENTSGFGESKINDTGIPWKKVVDALVDMQNDPGIYGGLLKYNGYEYRVNLNAIPHLPEEYRIGGDSISYIGLFQNLCEAAGYDYYFTLEAPNVITLHTVDRTQQPQIGLVNQFISTTPGAVSKRIGQEARQDITSKFIVGGAVTRLFGQTQQNDDNNDVDDSDSDFSDDTIWPYWGEDNDGRLIIGEGIGDRHEIKLDSRHIDVPGVGDTYVTDVEELRHAAISQSSWESFLGMKNSQEFLQITQEKAREIREEIWAGTSQYNTIQEFLDTLDEDVEYEYNPDSQRVVEKETPAFREYQAKWTAARNNGGQLPPAFTGDQYLTYYHQGVRNIHFLKATTMGFPECYSSHLSDYTTSDIDAEDFQNMSILAFSPMSATQLKFAAFKDQDFTNEELRREMYEFVASYAQEYYARRYMIRLPFLYTYVDDEELDERLEGVIKTSQEPTDAAYLDESDFAEAANQDLIPLDINKFTIEDGRFTAYVRFDDINDVDLSTLSETDYALGKAYQRRTVEIGFNGQRNVTYDTTRSVFIKCSVLPRIVYVDKDNAFSPRAIIEFPDQIFSLKDDEASNYSGSSEKYLTTIIVQKAIKNQTADPDFFERMITDPEAEQNVRELVRFIKDRPGQDSLNESTAGLYILPDFAAVPLKSNIQVYGPFFAVGAESKVDYEYNESLVPWNYGSFTLMQQAGNAMVQNAITNQTWAESGLVEYPGIPGVSLGSHLIAGGPLVSDIRCNVGPGGVTTSYTMKTWSKRLGQASNQAIENLKKLGKRNQEIRRKFRKLLKNPPPADSPYYKHRKYAYTKRAEANSSHQILIGAVKGENFDVVSLPNYHAISQVHDNYYDKAVVSMDTLYSPVSTRVFVCPTGYICESGYIWPTGEPGPTGDRAYSLLPSFQAPSGNQSIPSVLELNPYPPISGVEGSGDKYTDSILSVGSTPPKDGLISRQNFHQDGDCRMMALRGPLVVHGFGYTTDGTPVPANTGDPTKFADYYLEKPSTWPVGPVDLRWDHERKVWATGPQTRMGHLVRVSGLPYPDRPTGFVPSGIMNDRTFHVYELTPQPPVQHGDFIEVSGELVPISGAYIEEVSIGYSYNDDGSKKSYVCKNFDPNLVIPSGDEDDGDILVITQSIGGYNVPIYVGCEF